VDEVVRDVWARGAVIVGKCMAYLWVPLKRVSCTCHGCKCFQPHSCLLSFILTSFSFKRLVRGNCRGMVTSGGNVTH
jgi:hypothetical protein